MTPLDLSVLEADPWFAQIPADRRVLLLREARQHHAVAGARLYAHGDPANGLWAVLDGEVRLKGYAENGVELLALILRPGTWFGELSTLDARPRPHDAIAFGPTRLLHVPGAAFARAADADPGLYRDLGLLVCAHQRTALAYIVQSIAQPVEVRVARALIRSSRAVDGWLRIRQEELAAMAGVSRQTLNGHLKRFERAGLVELAYARILIRDLPGLEGVGAE